MEICVPWLALPDFHENEPFADADKVSVLHNTYSPIIYLV
jgi:hypothetical protein